MQISSNLEVQGKFIFIMILPCSRYWDTQISNFSKVTC